MSYVWSEPMSVRVGSAGGSGSGVGIKQVTVEIHERSPKVNEPVHVYVYIELTGPADDEYIFDVAIAINSENNIINTTKTYVLIGDTRTSAGFSLVFNKPGTYTIYGGAKFEKSRSYVWSQPVTIKIPSGNEELLKFAGIAAVIGGIVYMATKRKG